MNSMASPIVVSGSGDILMRFVILCVILLVSHY